MVEFVVQFGMENIFLMIMKNDKITGYNCEIMPIRQIFFSIVPIRRIGLFPSNSKQFLNYLFPIKRKSKNFKFPIRPKFMTKLSYHFRKKVK